MIGGPNHIITHQSVMDTGEGVICPVAPVAA